MKKNEWKKKMLAKMAAITLILGMASGTGAAVEVQAAENPLITGLQVVASEDGTLLMAQCDYQNYDDKSGCVMTLYLYQVGTENQMSIAAYKKIPSKGEGKETAIAVSVQDGIYLASVGMDYGGRIIQINSEHYYRVTRWGNQVEVTQMPDEDQNSASDKEASRGRNTCIHDLEEELVRPATAECDALMAKQCTICGAVLDYTEVPNSAYAAFQKETIEAILNASTDEIVIRTQRWISFHQSVLEAISLRPDVEVMIRYRYQGEEYEVTIPAGAEMRTLADENGFCGFRYLNLIFDESDL